MSLKYLLRMELKAVTSSKIFMIFFKDHPSVNLRELSLLAIQHNTNLALEDTQR